jgi:hypothetical protein
MVNYLKNGVDLFENAVGTNDGEHKQRMIIYLKPNLCSQKKLQL